MEVGRDVGVLANERALGDRQPSHPALPHLEGHRAQVLDHGATVVEQPEAVLAGAVGEVEVLVAEGKAELVEAADALGAARA